MTRFLWKLTAFACFIQVLIGLAHWWLDNARQPSIFAYFVLIQVCLAEAKRVKS